MPKKNENALVGMIRDTRRLYLQFKKQDTLLAVEDTINALWPGDMKPLIAEKKITPTGWFFVLHLPPGEVNYQDFKRRESYFVDATGGAVQITKQGKAVYMEVMTDELKKSYKYEWDPAPYEKMVLPFPVGMSPAGLLVRDFADIVNLLVAGHPGAGKSAFLHMFIYSLLLSRNVYLCIVDRKKLEYGYLRNYALVVTTDAEAAALFQALCKEMDRRLDVLEKAGCDKLQDYPDYEKKMPFVVTVIDELAELECEEAQDLLNRLVRLGRAPGLLHCVATQRPDSKTFSNWSNSKAMFPGTACFHVRDEINSGVVLGPGNGRAAHILNTPGRGIFQFDVEIEFQSMYIAPKEAKKRLAGGERSIFDVGESCKRLPPR